MPFARVGAMPQPAPNKQRNAQRHGGGNTSGRQKGITMEDLKKQTALRLAQEQQQQQGRLFGPSGRDPYAGGDESRAYSHPQAGLQPQSSNSEQRMIQNHGLSQAGYQVQDPQYQARYPTNSQSSQVVPQTTPAAQFNENRTMGPRVMAVQQPQKEVSEHQRARSPNDRYVQDPRSMYHQRGTTPASRPQVHPGPEPDNAPHRVANSQKQKLPHGLTVHELKEMTKARLQAEAAEKPDLTTGRETTSENRRVSPLDFDSKHENRERTMSRDSASRISQPYQQHDSMSSVPTMVQINQPPRDVPPGRQPQVSPLPPGFHGVSGPAVGRDQRQQQSKLDAWETASSASLNSAVLSENLGSESAFSSGLGGGFPTVADNDVNAFNRVRSFSAVQQGSSTEDTSNLSTLSPGNGAGLFGAAVGGNRRRAVTLSPKPVQIHEDKPHFYSEELRMPAFSSTSRGAQLSRPVSTKYSPVLELGLDGAFRGDSSAAHDMSRVRTSSTTSLPPIGDGSRDFSRDRANTFSSFSAGKSLPRNDEDISGALTESFLGYQLAPPRGGESMLAQGEFRINRSLNDNIVSTPPGFASGNTGGNANFSQPTAFSKVGALNSGLEQYSDPWNGDAGKRESSASPFFHSEGVENLTRSMGDILKLSDQTTTRPDRERSNTYPTTSTFVDAGFQGCGQDWLPLP